jgi:hypothetical protein
VRLPRLSARPPAGRADRHDPSVVHPLDLDHPVGFEEVERADDGLSAAAEPIRERPIGRALLAGFGGGPDDRENLARSLDGVFALFW